MHMQNKFDYNVLIWDLLILIQWMKKERKK